MDRVALWSFLRRKRVSVDKQGIETRNEVLTIRERIGKGFKARDDSSFNQLSRRRFKSSIPSLGQTAYSIVGMDFQEYL